jgi:hypothetical protein
VDWIDLAPDRTSGGLSWTHKWTFVFHKMLRGDIWSGLATSSFSRNTPLYGFIHDTKRKSLQRSLFMYLWLIWRYCQCLGLYSLER